MEQNGKGLSRAGQTNGSKPPVEETRGFGVVSRKESAELAAIATAAAAKARIEAQFILAIRNPRDEGAACAKIGRSCRNLTFAKKALFLKPVGKKKNKAGQWVQNYILGQSVRFAEEMIRSWKNISMTQTIVYEDDLKRITKVATQDLESNVSYDKEVITKKQVERTSGYGRDVVGERLNSKGEKVFIVRATIDEVNNADNSGISKAIRNDGLRLVPSDVKEDAMSIIMETLRNNIKANFKEEKKKIVDAFSVQGVLPSDIISQTGKPLDKMEVEEVLLLQQVINSLKEGSFTWRDYADKQIENKKEPGKGTLDGFKAGDASKATDVKMSLQEKKEEKKEKKEEPALKAQIDGIKKMIQLNPDLGKRANEFFLSFDKADYSELSKKEASEILSGMQK